MALEIVIPSPGESITEVELSSWFVEDNSLVSKNQEIGEIESERATLPLIAAESGKVRILVEAGETVEVGTVVAQIDTSVDTNSLKDNKAEDKSAGAEKADQEEETDQDVGSKSREHTDPAQQESGSKAKAEELKITPVAREMMDAENLSVDDILNGLKKIRSTEVKLVLQQRRHADQAGPSEIPERQVERKKISQLRKKISERLVAVKNETAMLTTFNEADMSAVMAMRKQYQEAFVQKHGIKLGFMSFFTKAVCESLKHFPAVNSYLEDGELLIPSYCDIGIAVQTEKGLMVPVLRNAEEMSLAEMEIKIADLAGRARKARLSIEEMSGGTFTISNGGIYGSMLSTPILNPPQSAILGMHNIQERPVAIAGKVEIRPMMYLALSYDHRVIDGRESVSFLKSVKTLMEHPAQMLFGNQAPEEILLDL